MFFILTRSHTTAMWHTYRAANIPRAVDVHIQQLTPNDCSGKRRGAGRESDIVTSNADTCQRSSAYHC
jgi:hypothetical protein